MPCGVLVEIGAVWATLAGPLPMPGLQAFAIVTVFASVVLCHRRSRPLRRRCTPAPIQVAINVGWIFCGLRVAAVIALIPVYGVGALR